MDISTRLAGNKGPTFHAERLSATCVFSKDNRADVKAALFSNVEEELAHAHVCRDLDHGFALFLR